MTGVTSMGCVEPGAIVYLVHGTFAEGAEWTGSHGMFAARIGQAIPGADVREIRWGGQNTHAARVAGGAKLARQIESDLAVRPGLSVFLIGHSHGGNVSLYAAAEPGVKSAIRGIACLGTPFIDVRPNHSDRYFRVFAALLSWVLLFAIFLVSVAVFAGLGVLVAGVAGEILGFLGVPVAVIYGWFFRERVSAFLAREFAKRGAALLPVAMSLKPGTPGCPTLVASANLDEAGVGLRLADHLGVIPHRLSYLAAYVAAGLFLAIVVLALGIGLFGGGATGDRIADPLISALLVAVALAVLGVVPAITWGAALRRVTLGRDWLWMLAIARIRISREPWWQEHRGSTRLRVRPPVLYWLSRKLRHSFFYQDERVVGEVVSWIRILHCDRSASRWATGTEAPAPRE